MERIFRRRSIVRMSVEVETPTSMKPEQLPQTSLSTEDMIVLKFQVQVICNHFRLQENGDASFVRQHVTRKIPFATHRLPVKFFHHSNGDALRPFLSLKFKTYGNRIFNIKTIADEILREWTKVEEEEEEAANSSSTFIVTLKLWNVAMHQRETVDDERMIPTSNNAIEMLTRVRIEEVECGQDCVICLESIRNEEECAILLLPCLHVFHEECIKKWLKNSHYCPTCRFEMPTD